MDDIQRILKCGNLSLHTPGGFFKKRWHCKYLVLYDGSKSGVKRLELFDSEIKFKKQNPAKIIPLVDCVRVVTCQRNKSTYTFEVRTNDHFYLLAAQSFQDMNDWVNCLRVVAFGQLAVGTNLQQQQLLKRAAQQVPADRPSNQNSRPVDVLLDQKPVGPQVAPASAFQQETCQLQTASQAAVAAASALAKTRQRQPSLLGSCKPLPPTDSPFIQSAKSERLASSLGGQLDTMTPTVRGQLIVAQTGLSTNALAESATKSKLPGRVPQIASALDEEEENMLYCSIEDNPSEHNYRVKVIETELSLRCQLKCYQLTGPTTISQQYEQLGKFGSMARGEEALQLPVTFYQLIVGPQELTLLNDYASSLAAAKQQQGLWSWPYQCIRRYGFDKDNCFMFEAGRKCTSGPGHFVVQTPKAYQIYQDVVKFVNELRSLSGNNNSIVDVPQAHLEGSLTVKELKSPSQITQIPVAWTPACSKEIGAGADQETREQFFNALRQIEGNCQLSAQPLSKQEKPPEVAEAKQKCSEALEKLANSNKTALVEETSEESGYEQDSVESTPSKIQANNKRALPSDSSASMSSACSTSSFSGSGGSPGHSMGRHSGNSLEGLNITKRPAIDTSRPPLASGPNNSRVPVLKLDDEQADFEANLIRDVYSEITKLHAKFAVTSGSGEDSMSSSSSNGSSCNEYLPDQQSPRLSRQQPARSGNNHREEEHLESYHLEPEPTYTNVSMRPLSRQDGFTLELHHNNFDDYDNKSRHQSFQSNNSYCQTDYLYNPSPFPTVLGPIPEEGGRGNSQRGPKVAPKPTSYSVSRQQASQPNSTSDNNSKSRSLSDVRCQTTTSIPQQIGRFNSTSQQRLLTTSATPQTNKSKLPTNHYVINDVQYAKISRNIRNSLL